VLLIPSVTLSNYRSHFILCINRKDSIVSFKIPIEIVSNSKRNLITLHKTFVKFSHRFYIGETIIINSINFQHFSRVFCMIKYRLFGLLIYKAAELWTIHFHCLICYLRNRPNLFIWTWRVSLTFRHASSFQRREC